MFHLPEKLDKVDNYFLEAITSFLEKNPNCILRDLKKEFVNVSGFDQKLETLILAGLVQRKERRYSLVVSKFPEDLPFKELMEELVDPVLKNLPKQLPFSNFFQGIQLPKRQHSIQVSDTLQKKMQPYLWERHEFYGKYHLIEWQNTVSQTTVSNYFAGKRDTQRLYDLEKLMGDVDMNYFLSQSLPKIFRAKKHPLKEARVDIFTQALILFDLLDENYTPQINFYEDNDQEELFGNLKGSFLKILSQLPYKENPAIYEHLTFLTQGYFLTKLIEEDYFKVKSIDGNKAWHYQLVKKAKKETIMAHHCVTLVPLFNHLPEEDQEQINQLTHHTTYKKGEIILSPLTEAKLLIIASGSLKIYQLSNSGKEQLLRVLGPGDYTGDKDLFGSKNDNLYGETLEATTLCVITQHDFQDLLLKKPAIALKLLQLNAKKMAETEKQSQFLATDAIEERLATYLLDLSLATNSSTVELPFKMKELAAFLGTTPETLSRKMKKMADEGYFTRKGRTITILNLEGLEDL